MVLTPTQPPWFQKAVKRGSRRKRKHGRQQTEQYQNPNCPSGGCGNGVGAGGVIKNVQQVTTTYSTAGHPNPNPVGINSFNSNPNQLVDSSHRNFRHGSLPKNFYTEKYGFSDRITSPSPFYSTPYHSFNASNASFNNIFPSSGTERSRLQAMNTSQWRSKNKYNIDYDNKLEDEYEIIHKIE